MVNTQTQEWKEIIKNRMDNYNKKVSEITSTLNKVVSELKVSPYNMRIESKQIEDAEKLTWEVKIGNHKHLYYLNDFQLGLHTSGKIIDSLEERIRIAILEKFKCELK